MRAIPILSVARNCEFGVCLLWAFVCLYALLPCNDLYAGIENGDTIVIGALFDLSGPGADCGDAALAGARAAVRAINAAGGVRGRDLELRVADTMGNSDRLLSGARSLNREYGAVILIGPETPSLNDFARRYGETYHRIVILVSGQQPLMRNRKTNITYTFGTFLDLKAEIKAALNFLGKKELNSVGLAVEQSPEGKRFALWFKGFSGEHDVRVACMGAFDPSRNDLVLKFSQLDGCGGEANVIWGDWASSTRIWSGLLGMSRPVMLFHRTLTPPVDENGKVRIMPLRMYGVAPPVFLQSAVPSWHPCAFYVRRFLRFMEDDLEFFEPRELMAAAQAWDAVHLSARALARSRSFRGSVLKETLEKEIGEFRGVTGVYRPDRYDHSRLDPKSLVIMNWTGRAWRPVR